MEKIKGSAKKYLRFLAHHLKPVVIVGKNGLSAQLSGSVAIALKDHELIKVKFGDFKEAKKEISLKIAEITKNELIGIIGNIAIFYRPHPKQGKRNIKIP